MSVDTVGNTWKYKMSLEHVTLLLDQVLLYGYRYTEMPPFVVATKLFFTGQVTGDTPCFELMRGHVCFATELTKELLSAKVEQVMYVVAGAPIEPRGSQPAAETTYVVMAPAAVVVRAAQPHPVPARRVRKTPFDKNADGLVYATLELCHPPEHYPVPRRAAAAVVEDDDDDEVLYATIRQNW